MPTTPSVIDLFAGAGGLSLGAARAGFKLALAVDKEPIFLGTHKKNFPKIKHWEKDISEISGSDLIRKSGLACGGLDGLIGGPPCQGFSVMGRRDFKDERNTLFQHFFRLVKELQPKFFVAENVLGIENTRYDSLREKAFDLVNGDYELLKPLKVQANRYGAATSRTRVFYIGFKPEFFNKISESCFEPSENIETIYVKDALMGLPESISPEWDSADMQWQSITELTDKNFFAERLSSHIPEGVGDPDSLNKYISENKVSGCLGTKHSQAIIDRYSLIEPGGVDTKLRAPRLKADGFCPTLRAGTGSDKGSYQAIRPIHHKENRVITTREAARLQGFPDWFVFHETKWHSFRQIGNSVSPLIAEILLKKIYDSLSIY